MRCTAETAEQLESLRQSAVCSRSRRRRSCETPEQTAARRSAQSSRGQHRWSCETAEQTAARLTAECCRSQRRRNAETPEQSAARRSLQRDCMQRRRQQLKSAVPLFEATLADVDSDLCKLSDTFSLHRNNIAEM